MAASREALAPLAAPVVGTIEQAGKALAGKAAGTIDNNVIDNAPTDAQYTQQQRQAAYQASPAAQLKQGDQQVQDAYASEAGHAISAAELDAAGQDIIANYADERNVQLDKLYVEREKRARENADAEEAKIREIGGMAQRIANTKIDRSLDNPVLAAIGVALAGLGSAMKHDGTNPALDMVFKMIDRKVQAQMQDLDLLKNQYGMSKDELQMFKDKSNRRLELYNTLLAGESDKAAKHIEAFGMRMQGDKTRANAKIIADQIRQKAGLYKIDAARWGMDYDQKEKHHKDQMGLQWFSAKESQRSNMVGESLKREDMYLDYQKAIAAAKASGDAAREKLMFEMTKENESRGIGNLGANGEPGEPLLTQKGIEAMKQAAAYEQRAAQIEQDTAMGLNGVPTQDMQQQAAARAQMYRDKAAEIRGTARTLYQFRARDPVEARDLSGKYSASQSVMDVVDDIRMYYDAPDGGRKLLATDAGRAKLQSSFSQLAPLLKNAWQLGAWDRGSAGLVKNVTGDDPSKWDVETIVGTMTTLAGTDPEAFKARLDVLTNTLSRDIYNQLRAAKWDVKTPEDLFRRRTAQAETLEGKALEGISAGRGPVAAEAAVTPGTAGKVRDEVYSFGGLAGDPAYKTNIAAAQESGSLRYPGIGANQEQGFDNALKMYKAGNQKIGPMLVAQVVGMAKTRPEDAIGMLHALRDHAGGDVYEKAVAQLPEGPVSEQIAQETKQRVSTADIPTPMLEQQILTTMSPDGKISDEAGAQELRRRALAKLPGAGEALMRITKRVGIPANSVFAGGR